MRKGSSVFKFLDGDSKQKRSFFPKTQTEEYHSRPESSGNSISQLNVLPSAPEGMLFLGKL